MKIGVKLGFGFGLVLAMLLIVSVVSVYQLKSVTDGFQQDVNAAWEILTEAERLSINILQIRRSEKDFLVRKDLKYFKRVNKFIEKSRTNTRIISQRSTGTNLKSKTASIQSNLDSYKSNFAELVSTYKERGLSHTEGAEGEFRKAAHDVDKILKEHNLLEAEVIYLTLRKHEKDYLLRADAKYIDKLHTSANELKTLVAAVSDLGQENKRKVNQLVDTYVKTFDRLVKKMNKIRTLQPVIKRAADTVLASAEEITEIAANDKQAMVDQINAQAGTAKVLVWTFSVISIAIGTLFAFLFARSLSVPLSATVRMIQELEKGHLGLRLNLQRSDEIGEMSKTMDAFADSLENEIVEPLQCLADGDITFDVRPRDDHDVLRGALKKTASSAKSVSRRL